MDEIIINDLHDLKDLIDEYRGDEKNLNNLKLKKDEQRELERMTFALLGTAVGYLTNEVGFAGNFASQIDFRISFDLKAPGAATYTEKSETSPAQMAMYYNPFWIVYKTGIVEEFILDGHKGGGVFMDSFKDLSALILHEMMHIMYEHHARFKAEVQAGAMQEVNIGTDTMINQDEFIQLSKNLMDYGITLEGFRQISGREDALTKQDSKYYVDILMEERKSLEELLQNIQQSSGNSDDDSNSGQGQGQGSGDDTGSSGGGSGDQDEQESDTNSGAGGSDQNQIPEGLTEEEIRDALDGGSKGSTQVWVETPDGKAVAGEESAHSSLVKDTQTAAESAGIEPKDLVEKSRGFVPASIVGEILEGVNNKTKIPEAFLVQKGLQSIMKHKDHSYARPNLYQSNNIRLLKGEVPSGAKLFRVYIDVSGSMSEEEVEFAVNEAAGVAGQNQVPMEVIQFESEVIKDSKVVIDRKGRYKFNRQGMGGTSFQPIFDHLREERKTNQNTFVMIVTDGYGEVNVETYGFKNVLWFLTGTKENTLSIDRQFGVVGWLDDDEKFSYEQASRLYNN